MQKITNIDTGTFYGFIAGIPYTESVDSIFQICDKDILTPTTVEIEKVDIEDGNILAYFSSIDGWKEPFKLLCISDGGRKVWAGRMPLDKECRFAKIDAKGTVKWENHEGNRKLPSDRQSRHSYFEEHPISFS